MIQASNTRLHITSVNDRPAICHVILAMGISGAEALVNQMMRGLSHEFRCIVAIPDEVGEIGERLQQDGWKSKAEVLESVLKGDKP